MVTFLGAGPGDPELITVKGARALETADVVVYAGSLVNPALLGLCKSGCAVYNSAELTLEQVLDILTEGHRAGQSVVRLHTGDPSLYGAIREQMDGLKARGIPYHVIPGVSSFSGAAAAVEGEYTLPGVSQSVILTRLAGRTPVPEGEALHLLAQHGCTMVIFLSSGMLDRVQGELLRGAYTETTPAALVYKATWPEERVLRCPLGRLAETGKQHGITHTALVLVGDFLGDKYERSKLYDPSFTTGFREGTP